MSALSRINHFAVHVSKWFACCISRAVADYYSNMKQPNSGAHAKHLRNRKKTQNKWLTAYCGGVLCKTFTSVTFLIHWAESFLRS
jgi:hypothetical protein